MMANPCEPGFLQLFMAEFQAWWTEVEPPFRVHQLDF